MKNETTDVWNVFLDRHDNNKTSETDWECVPEIQDELTAYLKATIDAGVVDGFSRRGSTF